MDYASAIMLFIDDLDRIVTDAENRDLTNNDLIRELEIMISQLQEES